MTDKQTPDEYLKSQGVTDVQMVKLTSDMDQAVAWQSRMATIAREVRRATNEGDWGMVEHLGMHMNELFVEVGINDMRAKAAVAALVSHLGHLLLEKEGTQS